MEPASPMLVSIGRTLTRRTPNSVRTICCSTVTRPWPTSQAAVCTVAATSPPTASTRTRAVEKSSNPSEKQMFLMPTP